MTDSGKVLLFLDIDGMLHPADREPSFKTVRGGPDRVPEVKTGLMRREIAPSECGLLRMRRRALLASILENRPDVDVVISSTWRMWKPYNIWDDELPAGITGKENWPIDWLANLLHAVIGSRIIGQTEVAYTRPHAVGCD
jgi:hypothetical protein